VQYFFGLALDKMPELWYNGKIGAFEKKTHRSKGLARFFGIL
jgi:hypothetical protein